MLRVAAGHLVGLHAATIAAASRLPDVVFRPVHPALSVSACALLRRDRADARLNRLLDALRTVAGGIDLATPQVPEPRAGTSPDGADVPRPRSA